jgi:hypothetical protein
MAYLAHGPDFFIIFAVITVPALTLLLRSAKDNSVTSCLSDPDDQKMQLQMIPA